MTKTLAIASLVLSGSLLAAVGCADHKEDMSTTGNNMTPNYEGSHYNPAVNSTGSGVGRTDPAVNPGAQDATGRMTTPPATPGGMSGTSDQNGGSSSPSGATGNTAGGMSR